MDVFTLCYLLTTPHPDRRMGWCRDFWWKRGGSSRAMLATARPSCFFLYGYRVLRSVCLYVCISQKSDNQTWPNFRCMLHVTTARSCAGVVAMRCVLPVLWMTPASNGDTKRACIWSNSYRPMHWGRNLMFTIASLRWTGLVVNVRFVRSSVRLSRLSHRR